MSTAALFALGTLLVAISLATLLLLMACEVAVGISAMSHADERESQAEADRAACEAYEAEFTDR